MEILEAVLVQNTYVDDFFCSFVTATSASEWGMCVVFVCIAVDSFGQYPSSKHQDKVLFFVFCPVFPPIWFFCKAVLYRDVDLEIFEEYCNNLHKKPLIFQNRLNRFSYIGCITRKQPQRGS